MNKKWLLLDCNYLCHRAFHTTGDLKNDTDIVGVIYGFLRDVANLQERFMTHHVVFCFDYGKPIRSEIYPEYKSARKQRHKEESETDHVLRQEMLRQIERLRKTLLKRIGFKNILFQNGMEADDMIAMAAKELYHNDEAVIVSADHDLYQCLARNVSMFAPAQSKTTTLQTFYKQYKIMPEQWAMVKAIAGCSSDSIQGIQGVGEKTALKFVIGTLKETHKTCDRIMSDEGCKIIERNLQLTTLPFAPMVPWKELFVDDEIDEDGWDSVVKELGFDSLKNKPPFRTASERNTHGKKQQGFNI
uniref:Putative exonuclease n=1 Tax=viral metagenome TaxID=1070528 RepID=A0A6M3IWM6_9ZZZZ